MEVTKSAKAFKKVGDDYKFSYMQLVIQKKWSTSCRERPYAQSKSLRTLLSDAIRHRKQRSESDTYSDSFGVPE